MVGEKKDHGWWFVLTEKAIWPLMELNIHLHKGEVMLLPAIAGSCIYQPNSQSYFIRNKYA